MRMSTGARVSAQAAYEGNPTQRDRIHMADLKNLKGVSDKDRRMIEEAESLLGPEPSKMGFIKNLFWGNFREDLVFPYPKVGDEEQRVCDQLLGRLENYLKNEHPRI